jgi:hypothetical protein
MDAMASTMVTMLESVLATRRAGGEVDTPRYQALQELLGRYKRVVKEMESLDSLPNTRDNLQRQSTLLQEMKAMTREAAQYLGSSQLL